MSELKELIPVLLEKTREGKVNWAQLATGSYIATVGNISFEVARIKGTNQFSLRSEEGQSLETVTWTQLQGPFDRALNDLFDEARRRAMGIPEAIQSAKQLLEDL